MKYAKGDTVYLPDGTECEYVVAFDNKFLVNMILMTGHEGELVVDPLIVSEVFPEPPVPKRARAIEELDKEIAAREKEISRLQREQRGIEARSKHFSDLIKRNEALQFVDAFLEGRVTHLVSVSEHGEIKILDFDKAIKAEERYDSGLKLLSLFGKSGGNLQWRLHKYSTEGGPVDIFPFFSFEAARDYAQTRINELTAEYIVDKNVFRMGQIRDSIAMINLSRETKLELPKYVREHLDEQSRKRAILRKEKLLEELQAVNRELGE